MTGERQLFLAQRVSAMLLAPLVVIHLVMILIAVRHGLSAEEILQRTRGNILWGGFYSLFVVAASVHAPIGLRNILREWSSVAPRIIDVACAASALVFLILGLRAVMAVI